ncbi:MAG: hypothetical protein IJZ88_06200 [Clostridia bacterium]|nr:hypothetical protein [Clostridia bacterium]
MKDNKEIIEATQKCLNSDCDGCDFRRYEYCRLELLRNLFCVVNRQQAEIERLQKENTELDGANILLTVTLQNAQSEARKEFAEMLKAYLLLSKAHDMSVVSLEVIDNLVKEMVGDAE